MNISKKSIIPKQVKLETLEDSVELIDQILEQANNEEYSYEQLLSLIKSLLSVYSIILDEEEIDDLIKELSSPE